MALPEKHQAQAHLQPAALKPLLGAFLGFLALRLGQAVQCIPGQWAIAPGFHFGTESLRAGGLALGAALLTRAWGASPAALTPLCLPLPGLLLALAPVPELLRSLGAASSLLGLCGVGGWLWAMSLERPRQPPGSARLAFATILALLLGLASQIPERSWLRQNALTGDEPEYMLTAVSLLDNGDVNLRNESEQDAAREFGASGYKFPFPHPIHNLGLPALIAPAYALGRWLVPHAPQRMVWVELLLLTAWLASQMYELGRERGQAIGWASAMVVFSALLLPMSVQVYPELPAAALALFAYRSRGGRRALALALLPWLHVKFAALAAGLIAARAIHPRQSGGPAALWQGRPWTREFFWRSWIRDSGPLFLSILALCGLNWLFYDSPLPTANYGRTTTVLSAGVLRGGLGLLFDQSFGLFVRTPLFFLLAPGAWLLWKRDRLEAISLGLVIASLFVVVASYHLWWAGWSPPGRFLVPIVPFLWLVALEPLREQGRIVSTAAILLGLVSLALGALLIPPPPTWLGGSRALIYQDPVEPSALLVLLSRGWDLCQAFPNLVTGWAEGWPQALAWAALALLPLGLLPNRSRPLSTTLQLLTLLLASSLLLGLASTLAPPPRHHHAQNQQARDFLRVHPMPGVLQTYEAEGLRGNHAFFEEKRLADGSGLRCALPFDPAKAPIPITFRYPVEFVPWPSGTYVARFHFQASAPAPVRIGVGASFSECTGRAAPLLLQNELTAPELSIRFQLRCTTPKLEWLVDSMGSPFCLDRVEVESEKLYSD